MCNNRSDNSAPWVSLIALLAVCLAATGCKRGGDFPTAAVSGKVLRRGEPLDHGTVMFVPDRGRPATGAIGSDGSFQLSTYGSSDGAIVGHHRVQVICQEKSRPHRGGEDSPGASLIPAKYTSYVTSGLAFDVAPGNNSFAIQLKD